MNVEQLLRATAAEIDWPPTPALVPQSQGLTAQRRGSTRRAVAIAFAALLLAAATAAAVPRIREPVLDWLGLRSVQVERVPGPLPEPRGSRLSLGRHTTLASARARLGFTPLLPSELGAPAVWFDDSPPGGQLSLVYRGGVLISQVQGQIERQFLFKFVQPGSGVEAFRIDAGRALWFQGPHQYAYADRTGALRSDMVRTAGSTLLWRRGELLIRIEGARTKGRAVRIARSLRAAP